MANYNKYINTFSGSTDGAEWSAYIGSEYAGFPNVAYLETSDMVKYRKTGTVKEAVGSIYYSDGSMTLPSENVDTTKTPIGIVVIPALNDYSAQLGYNTIICSLFDVKTDGTKETGQYSNGKWSTGNYETPLPNVNNFDSQDFDGKYNTSVLAASGSTYPAAYGCSLYSTDGTNVGDWYLPTGTEMMIAFSGGTTGNGQVINNSITKIRTALGSSYAVVINSSPWFWSSSEANSSQARYVTIKATTGVYNKTSDNSIRAFCRV